MFEKLDEVVRILVTWASQALGVTWNMLWRPMAFWEYVRSRGADGRLTLPAFATLGICVLCLDLAVTFAAGGFTELTGTTPQELITGITAQWPFLVHLLASIVVVLVLSALVRGTFGIPSTSRHATDRFAAYPTSLALAFATLVLLLRLKFEWVILMFTILFGVGIAVYYGATKMAEPYAHLGRLITACSVVPLGASVLVGLPLFIVISSEAWRPAPKPWISTALDEASIDASGLLSARLTMRSRAPQNIILQRQNVRASVRGPQDASLPILDGRAQIQSDVDIQKWSEDHGERVLVVPPGSDVWMEWQLQTRLACRECIIFGFHILLVFSLDTLSELPPQGALSLTDGFLGVPQAEAGERLLLVRCSLEPTRTFSGGAPERVRALRDEAYWPLKFDARCVHVSARPRNAS